MISLIVLLPLEICHYGGPYHYTLVVFGYRQRRRRILVHGLDIAKRSSCSMYCPDFEDLLDPERPVSSLLSDSSEAAPSNQLLAMSPPNCLNLSPCLKCPRKVSNLKNRRILPQHWVPLAGLVLAPLGAHLAYRFACSIRPVPFLSVKSHSRKRVFLFHSLGSS